MSRACQTSLQAVQTVFLATEPSLASSFLPALQLFPRLTELTLECEADEDRPLLPLDVPFLCSLPRLEALSVGVFAAGWKSALFNQAATALTYLHIGQVRGRQQLVGLPAS